MESLNYIVIFDAEYRARAFLRREGNGFFILEAVNGFANEDVATFLKSMAERELLLRIGGPEGEIEKIKPLDRRYFLAMLQGLERGGFVARPIEEYQKQFLLQLNDSAFDVARNAAMGDLLNVKEGKTDEFLKDLREGLALINLRE
ncbi:MAG: hypothetical protein KGJ13_00570 [Patescibacteria group bacterium]|nr:hypothetical protein [Patescibacteria group bacterium]